VTTPLMAATLVSEMAQQKLVHEGFGQSHSRESERSSCFMSSFATDLAGRHRRDSHNAYLRSSIHSQIVSNSDQSEPDPRGIL
jgi:hypothetical protein